MTISGEYSWGLVQTAEETYTESTQTTTELTCGDGVQQSGLWQWVIETSDGNSKARTAITVCKTGDKWQVPPACPFNACTNDDCTECAADWAV